MCGFGIKSRNRVITQKPTFFGAECPILEEKASCGQQNGGCNQHCNSATGACYCDLGYKLAGKMWFLKCSYLSLQKLPLRFLAASP